MPSVPEVSLIFDKPLSFKTSENTNFHSPFIKPKSLICKNNNSSSLNVNGSYASWKEQNYSWKHPSSYTISHKEQSKVEDNIVNTSNKSKEKNDTSRTDIFNSLQNREINRKNDDCFHKYNYEISENNVTHIERKQDTECNEKRHVDSMSAMLHINKPGINAENYIINENEYSPSLHKRKLTINDSKQKVPYNDSVPESNIQNLSINPNKLQQNEFQLPHYLGQYPYFNMNSYSFPQLPYSTHNTDNQETVKNLLQIINSQNEQIKSLQIQIDRLLKMQEENLREKKRCSCSFQSQEHDQLYANSNNNILGVSNYVTVPENTKKNMYQKQPLKDKRKDNYNENENINQNELILTDAQSKKTFMEKKVSIGVMTSFEFTVQNNPFTMDIENYEKKDSQQENFKMRNNVCLDTNESLRRYKNSFTRIPGAQLENIVEDSESYMSSSQQQNSNLNASTSTKDLEKQTYVDVRRETHIHRSESPKLCKDITIKLNETENKIKKHLKNRTEEETDYKTIKTSMIQRNAENAENHIQKNRKFKENILTNMDQNKKQNIQDNESIQTSNFVNKSNYYNDYQKEGQISRFKKINSIEDSLILNGDDLKINERPPSPEPSIHVEMNEYSSDDDSEHIKHSSKVGWTFYNNVIGRVNQLLQNSCIIDDQQQTKINQNERDEIENKAVLDTVKVATLEQLKKLGISLHENSEVKETNNSNKYVLHFFKIHTLKKLFIYINIIYNII